MVHFKTIALSCAAAAAVVVSAPASADWNSKNVYYDDLDLAVEKDQKRLETRIKFAVKKVCASPRPFSLAEKADQSKCLRESMSRAMPKAEQTIARYLESKSLASNEKAAVVGN